MNDEYSPLVRKDSESKFDHHKRLVYGKLTDKTLADYDYTELSLYVYGREYSGDVARRMFYGSQKTLELLDGETERSVLGKGSDAILDEMEEKRIELQKERYRFQDQRREYNKLVQNDGRREHLYASLIDAANRLADDIGLLYNDYRYDREYEDCEAVLVFSDWHYGLKTSNVFNTYDTEICKARVCNVVEKAIDRIRLHKCRKLHIAILGDLFHGAIHTSARVASEELVCDQLMQVSEILAQSIEKLSDYVEETTVYMTYGNHARTVQNKADSIHRDNMERLVPWWLRTRLAHNDSIIIADESEDEFLFLDVCGYGLCASHGDLDSVSSAPRVLPALLQKKYGRSVDCIILGDKHHRESFNEIGVTAMVCGSLCGTDDYANSKRLYSAPEQLLLIVNGSEGVDAEYRIRC